MEDVCEIEVSFENSIQNFLVFLRENRLTQGTISNIHGDKAIIKRDKHGFYKVNTTIVSMCNGE